MRDNLLDWQWSDYAAKHRNRANLLIHILAVPAFELAALALVAGAVMRSPKIAIGALVALIVAFAAQGAGHKREAEQPAPFAGPGDVVARILAEQFITFPRFVLTGAWARNLKQG
jgi:hypothetical protein